MFAFPYSLILKMSVVIAHFSKMNQIKQKLSYIPSYMGLGLPTVGHAQHDKLLKVLGLDIMDKLFVDICRVTDLDSHIGSLEKHLSWPYH